MKYTLFEKFGTAALVAIIALSAACGSDEGDGSLKGVEGGLISADRSEVTFSDVALGGTSEQGLRISNLGTGNLNIRSIRLIEDTDSDEGGVEFQRGEDWVSTANLEPNEFIDLTIFYSPLDQNPDEGKVVIESNDPSTPTLTIPVNTADLEPNIFSRENIIFQRVPPITEETRNKFFQISEVQNIGQAPLTITDVVITGGDDFAISYPTSADSQDPSTDSDSHPTTLGPDENFPIRVYFNPQDNLPSTADLIFFTNDPDTPQYTVKLQGNSGAPCIKLSQEDEINFGEGGIGFANNKTITIENCSPTSDLEVSSISITDDGGGVYSIKDGSLPPGLPDANAIVPPDNTRTFVLTYTPTDESTSTGELTVESNDPAKATLRVPILGKGTNNVCPNAVAEARLEGSSRYQQQISTIPLKNIEFRGTNSVDQNGSVANYEWTIVQRPANSTAQFDPAPTHPEPKLFLDLAGVYVIELTVYDDQGLASCNDDETRQITIRATPDEDIHVQLVWDTPTDPDDTDTNGTDVDIHYLHPNGTWNNAPYDIFWRNATADWGTSGGADDPSLDIDDTDGAGPENVNHNNPQSGLSYAIGVYYYNDFGFGPSYATLRIYIEGVQKYEYRDQYLAGKGVFWYAATISWPSKNIFAVNETTPGFPTQ